MTNFPGGKSTKINFQGAQGKFPGVGWYFISVKPFLGKLVNTPVWTSNGIVQCIDKLQFKSRCEICHLDI